MFEWHRASDSDASFDLITDERRQWQPPRHWRLWLAGIAVLCLTAGIFLYWRLAERTAAMRTDVERIVQYEAAQRRLGPTGNLAALLDPAAPDIWKSQYADEVAPASDTNVTINAIEFYRNIAVVTLHADGQPYVHVYRLVDQEWRRTPVTPRVWGGLRTAQLAPHLTIRYHERDSTFVERLLDDVPAFLREHPNRSGILEVVIAPEEFGPVILQRQRERVILNSPLLAASDRTVGSEAAVRQALADILATNPPPEPTPVAVYRPMYPPFNATVSSVNQETGSVLVDVAGWGAPIDLEAGAAELIGPDGTALPAGCAGLYRRFTIDAGAWRTPGEALTASRITVHDAAPSAVVPGATFPPPAGTIALLLQPALYGDSTRAYTVLAVTQDGRTRELANVTSLHPIWPAQPAGSLPLLLAYSVPGCSQSWFFVYDPDQGSINQRLSSVGWEFGNAAQFVWQPQKKEALLFVWPRPTSDLSAPRTVVDAQRHSVLNTSRLLLTDQFGVFTGTAWSRDWRTDIYQRLTLAETAPEAKISLVDVLLGDSQVPAGARMALSGDGTHLFYATDTGPSTLSMLDLTSGTTTPVLEDDAGEQLQPIHGGNVETRAFVLARNNDGSRLLAFDPIRPQRSPERITETTAGEQIVGAITCGPARLLYVVVRDGQFQVYIWQAGQGSTQLTTSDATLIPWACRGNL